MIIWSLINLLIQLVIGLNSSITYNREAKNRGNISYHVFVLSIKLYVHAFFFFSLFFFWSFLSYIIYYMQTKIIEAGWMSGCSLWSSTVKANKHVRTSFTSFHLLSFFHVQDRFLQSQFSTFRPTLLTLYEDQRNRSGLDCWILDIVIMLKTPTLSMGS